MTCLLVGGLTLGACSGGGDGGTGAGGGAPSRPTSAAADSTAGPDPATGTSAAAPLADLEDDLVVLCTVSEEWCQASASMFGSETGVDTDYVRLSTGEAIARLEAEGDDPSFDVWFGGPSVGPSAAAGKGLIEPYQSPAAAAIPDDLKAADGTWTGIYVGVVGFCSNAELLGELGVGPPETWDDLLDDALRDNIAMADQRTSGTAVTAAASLVALRGSEDAAIQYLRRLDANIFQYTRSGSAPGRMAAQGEVATSVVFAHDCVAFELETGVDLALSFPSDGTGFEVGQVSVIANAAHPAAARAFVDWALRPASQEIGATVNAFQLPSHPDAVVPDQAISLDEIVLADGYSPQLAEDLSAGGFPERFADEVRGGADEPAD